MDKTIYKGKDYLTREKVVEYFKVKARQLIYWEEKGLIEAIKIHGYGTTRFYEYDSILSAIKSKK